MTAESYPRMRQVVLDCTDARELAEFYRQLLGFTYRPGDEPPAPGEPDPQAMDELVLRSRDGSSDLAFQYVTELPRTTWPEHTIPQQLHLDCTVGSVEELTVQHQRALALGAELLLDRSADPKEPLYAYADPAGHPFCIFVSPN